MAQRDLERLLEVRGGRHGGENGCDGRTNVRSERQRVGPFEGDHPDADERREGRGEYGAGLDEYGHASADQNGHVTGKVLQRSGEVRIDDLLDDLRDLAAEQGVEKLYDASKTDAENEEGDEQQDDADVGVAQAGVVEEEAAAVARRIRTVLRTAELDEARVSDVLALGDLRDQFLVDPHDHVRERFRDLLQQFHIRRFALCQAQRIGYRFAQVVQVPSGRFDRQECDDAEPVEDVVHGRSCERSPKLVPIANVPHRDDRVRHRGSDVGSHHNRDGFSYIQNFKKKKGREKKVE